VGALDLLKGATGGFHQAKPGGLVLFDQLDDGLGIRIGLENYPSAVNFVPQFQEILDDAVMHHDHTFIGAEMGMGVAGGRHAVGGPAGMPDAG